MTTETLTLTDFLLARIGEEEGEARAASPPPWSFSGIASVAGGTLYDKTRRIVDVVYEQPGDHDGRIVRHLLVSEADANGAHIARHDPSRVLAECEAKRRIVELHRPVECIHETGELVCHSCGVDDEWHNVAAPCPTLRALAAVYADHPDYRDEWRVG